MKTKRINAYLIGAILTLSVIPLMASYYLLDEVLQSAIGLTVKPQSKQLLEQYRNDLKTLRQLDPDNEADYKAQFLMVSDELVVYQQPHLLRQILRDTYLTYYLIIFVFVLLITLLVAVGLSRKVARSYKHLVQSDIDKAQRLQELSNFDQWQVIAGKLAHEINNPLTPIEMMVGNLPRSYAHADPEMFEAALNDTKSVVSEEVHKLKAMVSHFSRFSKLPEPVLKPHSLAAYCTEFVRQHAQAWPMVTFSQVVEPHLQQVEVLLDNLLFNQCLLNIINNAVQANPDKMLKLELTVEAAGNEQLALVLYNDGKAIAPSQIDKLFKMYFSTNSHKENMGLGLAIVKKIMLDHGGNVQCLPLEQGAAFKLTLPKVCNE